jgi:transcriptional regulator with XRE-family HTH domain
MRRYWGVAEIAEACGVGQNAVSNWLARRQMPDPAFRLRMGPVWDASKPAFREWLIAKRRAAKYRRAA